MLEMKHLHLKTQPRHPARQRLKTNTIRRGYLVQYLDDTEDTPLKVKRGYNHISYAYVLLLSKKGSIEPNTDKNNPEAIDQHTKEH